ncbi:hypothetical protein C5F59_006050 [Streptomyces sp. QL37]|uniref:hypothetical protein n=1 Tax=Streptomyces sp. QL37 TaxID=2093747 RepID=UPI0021CB47C0|nr:hypothetical protein [Streptomyces sp. QL37]
MRTEFGQESAQQTVVVDHRVVQSALPEPGGYQGGGQLVDRSEHSGHPAGLDHHRELAVAGLPRARHVFVEALDPHPVDGRVSEAHRRGPLPRR